MVNDFPGFEATVICFDPGQENSEGCTRPLGANMTEEATTPGDQKRRRKRDLENFVILYINSVLTSSDSWLVSFEGFDRLIFID